MKSCPTCKSIYPTDFTVCPRDGVALRPVTEFEEGAIIRGKYKILSLLGRGGMGTVYKAQHVHFNEVCALKVIGKNLTEEAGFVERFRAEAVVMRRLDHPNAVRVHDFDETEDGRPFIVMEYVQGSSLDKALATNQPLEYRRAVRIAAEICGALGAAHRLGIIHRDIKPANILLAHGPGSAEGEVAKVLDFGLAKVKEQGTLAYGVSSLTGTGFVVGTPAYMSPEQAQGMRSDQLDGRTDLYSLGVALYEMLTGRLPFDADTPVQLLLAHVQATPPDPRTVQADLPSPLAQLVLRALAKDPAQRFPTAEAMQEALDKILKEGAAGVVPGPAYVPVGQPLSASSAEAPTVTSPAVKQVTPPAHTAPAPVAQPPTAPRWLLRVLGGVAVLTLVLTIILFFQRRPPSAPAGSASVDRSSADRTTSSPSSQDRNPAQVSPTAAKDTAESDSTPGSSPSSTALTRDSASDPPPSSATGPTPNPLASTKGVDPRDEKVKELLLATRAAFEKGDVETATRYLREAYTLAPDNPVVQKAVEQAQRALASSQSRGKSQGTTPGAQDSPQRASAPGRPQAPPSVNLAGRWLLSVKTPRGKFDARADLAMTRDGTLRGTLSGSGGAIPITNGWVSGNRFSFTANIPVGQRSAVWVYTGTAEGRFMNGTVTVGTRTLDFTGIRQSARRDRKPSLKR